MLRRPKLEPVVIPADEYAAKQRAARALHEARLTQALRQRLTDAGFVVIEAR